MLVKFLGIGEAGCKAHFSRCLGGKFVERRELTSWEHEPHTLPRSHDLVRLHASKTAFSAPKRKIKPEISSCRARIVLRPRGIREEIIGRSGSAFCCASVRLRGEHFASLMFEKPSGHHRGSELLYPLFHERSGFLSKVSRVSETRELVTLKRIARSRQQEFPRGKDVAICHAVSPK